MNIPNLTVEYNKKKWKKKMEQKHHVESNTFKNERSIIKKKNPGKIKMNGKKECKKNLNQNTNITGTMLKTLRFFLFHFQNFMHKSINV